MTGRSGTMEPTVLRRAVALTIGVAVLGATVFGPGPHGSPGFFRVESWGQGNGNGNGNVGNFNGNGNRGNFNGNGNLGSGNGNANATNGNGNFRTGNGAGNGNRMMPLFSGHDRAGPR